MASREEVLRWGEKALKEAGIAEYKTDAWLLYEEVTGISRARFFLVNQEKMPQPDTEVYESQVEKRCQRIPLQHLTGRQEFMGLEFEVNEHVLIPRFDTEVLVAEVEKYISGEEEILDMCCGSGCIAIALKKRHGNLKVTAVDASTDALKVAEQNCRKLQADVRLVCSDLFEVYKQSEQIQQSKQKKQLKQMLQLQQLRPCEQVVYAGKYDVIVSNPPYIPTKVIEGLDEEVRCHEPMMALDGREDGLEFYRRIVKDGKAFLKKDGMLFFEIGHDQAEAVSSIMKAEGFCNIQVRKDFAGLDRVVYGGIKNV